MIQDDFGDQYNWFLFFVQFNGGLTQNIWRIILFYTIYLLLHRHCFIIIQIKRKEQERKNEKLVTE